MSLSRLFNLATGLLLGMQLSAQAQTQQAIRWLDLKRDKGTLLRIETALKDVQYTHLRDVFLVDKAALIVVSQRPRLPDSFSTDYDSFQVFGYVLDGKHRLVELWRGYKLQLLGDARFEESTVPDLVFQYDRCVECEPETFVAAFHFDAPKSTWTLRTWGDREPPGALVGSMRYLEEWTGQFVYAVEDLDGDKFDDIGVWLRETNPTTGEVQDYLDIYTVKEGKETVLSRKSAESQRPIKKALCNPHGVMNAGSDLSICREFQTIP